MISIIVPIYNSEKYLNQCVDSLINQTYKDIEIILVDDGSTDSSGLICDEYAKKDRRVTVIHQPNGRIAKARNAGIEAAKGEFLSFIDSDDYFKPETIETALTLLKNSDADMVQWDLEYLPEDGYTLGANDINKPESEVVSYVVSGVEAVRIMLDSHNPDPRFNNICQCCNCVWPKLFKKELFETIRFPVGKEFEDLAIVHRLYQAADRVVFTNSRFSVYRLRNTSVVHSMKPQGVVDGLEAFIDKYNMVMEWDDEKAMALRGLVSHVLLAVSITTYAQIKETSEVSRMRDMLKHVGNYSRFLTSQSDKMMYHLFSFSPYLANLMVVLRRKLGKLKKAKICK